MLSPSRKSALVLAGVLLGAAPLGEAHAHGPVPSEAPLFDPANPCEVIDRSFTFTWRDYDAPIATGTATEDFYYTQDNTPTFQRGLVPDVLRRKSIPIITGILEKDPTNAWTWDTSAVPSGSYWIWSYVNDPPAEVGTVSLVSFSPNVLTVRHPPEATYPAIVISSPDDPFRWSHEHFTVKFRGCDPIGGATVRLEATHKYDGTEMITIADNLPVPVGSMGEPVEGSFDWDTRCLAEGDWTVKATITDREGRSFSAFGIYFLLVAHLSPACGAPDAGMRADGGRDGSPTDAALPGDGVRDAGGTPSVAKKSGCRCATGGDPNGTLLILPMALWLFAQVGARSGRRREVTSRA